MPLSEMQMKEYLRAATDWLVTSDLAGAPAAREGIADVIGLTMMDAVGPMDKDELISLVVERGEQARSSDVGSEDLLAAVTAAFDHARETLPG